MVTKTEALYNALLPLKVASFSDMVEKACRISDIVDDISAVRFLVDCLTMALPLKLPIQGSENVIVIPEILYLADFPMLRSAKKLY